MNSLHRLGLSTYLPNPEDNMPDGEAMAEAEKELLKHISCMAHVINHPEVFSDMRMDKQIDMLREKLQEYDRATGKLREI